MTEHQIAVLLEPISESCACGPDLQYDTAYDRIRLARQVRPQQLPAGVWEKEDKKADWHAIANECVTFLKDQSKDLQVVAWLSESLVKTQGLAGLRQGLDLMDRLSHTFWEQIHPLPDEEDWSNRLRTFEWLGRELPGWLATHMRADNGNTQSQLQLQRYVEHMLHSLQNLRQLLQDKLGETVVAINDSIDQLKTLVEQWHPTNSSHIESHTNIAISIGSRAAAYEQLKGIAEFLAKHEPHSPVPGILRALCDWQNCEFGELLERLPTNGPSVYDLARLFTLAKDRA